MKKQEVPCVKRIPSEQEDFWKGTFGDEYIGRNQSDGLLAANLALFARLLGRTHGVESVIEFGANIGMNLKALRALRPAMACTGIEINAKAASEMATIPGVTSLNASLFDCQTAVYDLAFVKGVLIHQSPALLTQAYQKLAEASRRYVAIIEYYNPSPVEIPYRGHSGRLFKRDFAGEFLAQHGNFGLLDYGFIYHGDPVFPQDDLTWFLMERKPNP